MRMSMLLRKACANCISIDYVGDSRGLHEHLRVGLQEHRMELMQTVRCAQIAKQAAPAAACLACMQQASDGCMYDGQAQT